MLINEIKLHLITCKTYTYSRKNFFLNSIKTENLLKQNLITISNFRKKKVKDISTIELCHLNIL